MADKKRNNASWCCDKIEELILEKKKEIEELNKEADSLGGEQEIIGRVYGIMEVIDELEEILYGN